MRFNSALWRWLKPLLIVPPIAVGGFLLWWLSSGRTGPEQRPPAKRRTPVRAIQVVAQPVVPRVLGYGVAEPARTWQAVAQVPGRVLDRHPRLVEGGQLPAEAVLVRIDPQEYQLAIDEADAAIQSLDARLLELDGTKQNTESTLEVERRTLQLQTDELRRKRELLEGGSGSQAEVDAAERAYLGQAAKVQDLDNVLRLIPAQTAMLLADKKATEAQLATARLNRDHTTISTPFAAVVAEATVEESQYVSVGQVLAELHDISAAEVTARMPMAKFRHLIEPGQLRVPSVADAVSGEMVRALGVEATVRLRVGDLAPEWPARIDRFAPALDPQTRAIGVVAVIDKPYAQVVPGKRPPVVRGMYLEVEIRGRAKLGRVLVPRVALHSVAAPSAATATARTAYVADADDRLQRRTVQVEFTMQDFAVVAAGLAGGETLVVTDPIPAIEGMLLEVIRDADLEARLTAVARGEAGLR